MPLFDSDRKPIDGFELRRQLKQELEDRGVLPAVKGLFSNADASPLAILLSHAHLDHTGLIEHTQPNISVYASRGTSKMMLAGKLFAGQVLLAPERFVELVPEVTTTIGPFTVTGFSVDHSIYGCMAFLIEADGKRLLYSGDLRMHGRKPGMHRRLIQCLESKPIDLMLMEGTHLSFPDGNPQSEYELEETIAKAINSTEGVGFILPSECRSTGWLHSCDDQSRATFCYRSVHSVRAAHARQGRIASNTRVIGDSAIARIYRL